jgi:aspartate-semialdehyde dehydrogenase
MTQPKIAITHSSSLLAEALLKQMSESGLTPDSVVLLDEQEQAGNRLSFADTYITSLDQYEYDYENLAAVFLLQEDTELEDLLQHADCHVISHFPENNRPVHFFDPLTDIAADKYRFIEKPGPIKLATAELSTLLTVLRPLAKVIDLNSVQVVNVLSASIFGKPAMDELASQTIELLNSRDVTSSVFPLQMAFNMIPQPTIDGKDEVLCNFFPDQQVSCSVQSILVPAFNGLSISVVIESNKKIDVEKVKKVIQNIPSVSYTNERVSPYTHCKDGNKWIIYGLNQPQKEANRLQFWIIADSIRNGLINNYQNVLEFLLNSYL